MQHKSIILQVRFGIALQVIRQIGILLQVIRHIGYFIAGNAT